MTEFEKGYEQGYNDGTAGAALPNVNDNGDKIDGYSYAYKTDSIGEPYIHIDSVRSMLKIAADVQPERRGKWIGDEVIQCSICNFTLNGNAFERIVRKYFKYCPNCGARMDGDTE